MPITAVTTIGKKKKGNNQKVHTRGQLIKLEQSQNGLICSHVKINFKNFKKKVDLHVYKNKDIHYSLKIG